MSEEHSIRLLHDALEALARRVEELNAELAAVRHELREQRRQSTEFLVPVAREELGSENADSSAVTSLAEDQPEMSRRHALRAAGVLAAGAVAGGAGIIAAASPAAAATGTFNGGSPAVTANGGAGAGSVGVDAQVQGTNGIAVDATSLGNDGIGVRGNGDGFGVYGNSSSGTGIYGETMGQFAVFGQSAGAASDSAGVYGRSMSGRGLHGYGDVGVYAQSLNVGVSIDAEQTSLRFSTAATSPLTSGATYQTRDIVVDSAGVIWFCVAGGTPGTWRMLSGPSTAGAFTPLTPGRVYDSRLSTYARNGVLGSGQDRTLSVANSYDVNGGLVTTNFVPVGATAVFANVTVVDTVGAGYLAVNPGGTTVVSASTINWSASGQILANGVTLTLNGSRQVTAINGSGGSTNFIVDVLGYYR